jgi:intraflagellar transport protein 52
MTEGGEARCDTNLNYFLEEYGISVNSDCVVRSSFYKYFHPKENYISNGILNDEISRFSGGKPAKS